MGYIYLSVLLFEPPIATQYLKDFINVKMELKFELEVKLIFLYKYADSKKSISILLLY